LKLRPRGLDALGIGEDTVRIAGLEQIVEGSQVAGIGVSIAHLVDAGHLNGRTLAGALDGWERMVEEHGVGALGAGYAGDFALPRRFEIAAVIDRLPSLRVRSIG
jgi:hypothetical protein